MKQDAKLLWRPSSCTCAQLDTSLLNLLPDTFRETRFFFYPTWTPYRFWDFL
jgi:hypothetical protein